MEIIKRSIFFLLLGSFICTAGWAADSNENEPNYFDWSKTDKEYRTLENDSSLIGKLFSSIIVIIILGTAAYYVTKKMGPKIGRVSGKNIQVIETINLGSGRQLHYLEMNGKRILIGSTSQNITKITEAEVDESGEVK